MAPAALEHLSSHAGLPSSEPVAEHPSRSLMSEPTSSQSRRIWILAAEMTLAAMCAGCVGCSGRDLARQ